jgi:hypothetical protein
LLLARLGEQALDRRRIGFAGGAALFGSAVEHDQGALLLGTHGTHLIFLRIKIDIIDHQVLEFRFCFKLAEDWTLLGADWAPARGDLNQDGFALFLRRLERLLGKRNCFGSGSGRRYDRAGKSGRQQGDEQEFQQAHGRRLELKSEQ